MKHFDVVGLGNALLDLIINVDDSIILSLNLPKGHMTLVDEKQYENILLSIAEMKSTKASGGSASNTIKGVSTLGGSSAFMGMVGNDEYANHYRELLNASGVQTSLVSCNKNTGVAITFITPDGERTFATYLGASLEFTEKNIDESLIENCDILHIEGFFLEGNHKNAALAAMNIAKKYAKKISVDLSDPSLINRNHESFKKILEEYVNIVFVNEHEAKAFTGKNDYEALHILSDYCEYSIVKLGSKGSIIKHKNVSRKIDQIHTVPIHDVAVINTNGAGDAYAAGILFGISHNLPLDKAGMIAALISGKVVASSEATLTYSLKDEIEKICVFKK